MIPKFPEFKKLEWTDRKDVEQITNQFPPYSDFNFVSLWSWNTKEMMQLSLLHGNLVVLFYDYLTEKPFLSFIGSNCIEYTASMLIEFSIKWFQEPCLRLIPECVATNIQSDSFSIKPDEDANDYILSVPYLNSLDRLPTNKHQAARYIKRFMERYPHYTVVTSSPDEAQIEACISLFQCWAHSKGLNHDELNEYGAFVRFLNNRESDNTIIALYDNEIMIGFAFYELLTSDYAMGHFLKADSSYRGLNEVLHFLIGKKLSEHNARYWNYEQDLGLPSLRRAKRKYKPEFYLKKYSVSQIQREILTKSEM